MSVSSNDSFEQLSDMEPDFVASDDSFQDAVEELKELKEQKEAMVKAMESELERIKVATEEKEGVIEDLSKKVETLVKERDLAVSEFADLYEELKDQKQASENVQLDMRHEMDALKDQLKEKNENITNLNIATVSLMDEVRAKAKESAALVKERDSMVLEVSKLNGELEDFKWNSENTQQHLTREIEDLKKKNSALRRSRKEEAKQQLKESEVLRTNMKKLEENVQDMVEQTNNFEVVHIQIMDQHNAEKIHLNQKIENLQDANAELIAQIESQGQEIVALKAEKSEAETQINSLKEDQEKKQEIYKQAQEYFLANERHREQMFQEVEVKLNGFMNMNDEIARLYDVLYEKNDEIRALKTALKTEKQELTVKFYKQEKEQEKVEEERDLVVQEFADLYEEMKEKKKAEKELLQELQELDASKMKQDEVCAKMQEDLEAANSYIQVLQAEKSDLTKRLDEQKKEHVKVTTDSYEKMKKERNEALTQKNSLKKELEALLEKQKYMRSDYANLYSELLATQGQLSERNQTQATIDYQRWLAEGKGMATSAQNRQDILRREAAFVGSRAGSEVAE